METKAPNTQAAAVNNAEEAAPVKKINKKAITIGAICVAVVAAIILVVFFINEAGVKKANEAIAVADLEMNDSIALERYIDAAKLGHKSGNRAKLHAAIGLYKKGDYKQALQYLDDASISSEIVDAGRLTLMGDCYVNLQEYDKALSCYNKAISASDNNPQVAPFVLVKEANVYRAQGKHEDEYKAYEKIYKDYPEYAQRLNFDIRKYAERARIEAGK